MDGSNSERVFRECAELTRNRSSPLASRTFSIGGYRYNGRRFRTFVDYYYAPSGVLSPQLQDGVEEEMIPLVELLLEPLWVGIVLVQDFL